MLGPADGAEGHFLHAWRLALAAADTSAGENGADRPAGGDAARCGVGAAANVVRSLASEVCRFYRARGELSRLRDFVSSVPRYVSGDELTLSRAKLALEVSTDPEAAKALLRRSSFPTFSGQRSELGALWHAATYAAEAKRLGRPLTAVEMRAARRGSPLPQNIGPFD